MNTNKHYLYSASVFALSSLAKPASRPLLIAYAISLQIKYKKKT